MAMLARVRAAPGGTRRCAAVLVPVALVLAATVLLLGTAAGAANVSDSNVVPWARWALRPELRPPYTKNRYEDRYSCQMREVPMRHDFGLMMDGDVDAPLRFRALDFAHENSGETIAFVGDSLNYNLWVSLTWQVYLAFSPDESVPFTDFFRDSTTDDVQRFQPPPHVSCPTLVYYRVRQFVAGRRNPCIFNYGRMDPLVEQALDSSDVVVLGNGNWYHAASFECDRPNATDGVCGEGFEKRAHWRPDPARIAEVATPVRGAIALERAATRTLELALSWKYTAAAGPRARRGDGPKVIWRGRLPSHYGGKNVTYRTGSCQGRGVPDPNEETSDEDREFTDVDERLQERFAGSGVSFMILFPLLRGRPDAHRGHTPRSAYEDCLHQCLPGPFDAVGPELLRRHLLRRKSADGGTALNVADTLDGLRRGRLVFAGSDDACSFARHVTRALGLLPEESADTGCPKKARAGGVIINVERLVTADAVLEWASHGVGRAPPGQVPVTYFIVVPPGHDGAVSEKVQRALASAQAKQRLGQAGFIVIGASAQLDVEWETCYARCNEPGQVACDHAAVLSCRAAAVLGHVVADVSQMRAADLDSDAFGAFGVVLVATLLVCLPAAAAARFMRVWWCDEAARKGRGNGDATPAPPAGWTTTETGLLGAGVFGVVLLAAYLFDGPQADRLGEAAPKAARMDLFWMACAAVAAVAVAKGPRPLPERATAAGGRDLFHRLQTEEWKGWMQAAFVLYHYFDAQPVYNTIRVFIAAYLWMTGFGNCVYYRATGNFSLARTAKTLVRLNLLCVLTCLVLRVEYMVYYVCPLHTAAFFFVLCVMAVWPAGNASGRTLSLKLAVAFVLLTAVFEYDALFRLLFGWVPGLRLRGSLHEWQFRSTLDHYMVWVGMATAAAYPRLLAGLHTVDAMPRPQRWAWRAALASLGAAGVAVFALGTGPMEKYAYNAQHPYTAFLPVMGFLLLRNLWPAVRHVYFPVLQWIGCVTLETYILQSSVYMLGDAKQMLVLWPGIHPVVNFAITSALFLGLSRAAFWATHALSDWWIPPKATARETLARLFVGSIVLSVVAAVAVFLQERNDAFAGTVVE